MRGPSACCALTAMLAFGHPLSAQSLTDRKPPIEIAAGFGSFWAADLDMSLSRRGHEAPEIRVTFPWSPRFAVEVVLNGVRRRSASTYFDGTGAVKVPSDHWLGIYAVQVRQRLAEGRTRYSHWFATYGVAGYYDFERIVPTPLRSISGQTTVIQGTRRTIVPPLAGLVGIGIQAEVLPRLAVRADLQAITITAVPFGLRGTVVLVVPMRPYR